MPIRKSTLLFTEDMKAEFLMALKDYESVNEAHRSMGLNGNQAYHHKKLDPVFAAKWNKIQANWDPTKPKVKPKRIWVTNDVAAQFLRMPRP